MPGLGTGMSDARHAGTDPVSALACGQVAAGIPRRGIKDMPQARNCSGYVRAQQSSNGQASNTVESSSTKAWCFHSSFAVISQSNAAMLFM